MFPPKKNMFPPKKHVLPPQKKNCLEDKIGCKTMQNSCLGVKLGAEQCKFLFRGVFPQKDKLLLGMFWKPLALVTHSYNTNIQVAPRDPDKWDCLFENWIAANRKLRKSCLGRLTKQTNKKLVQFKWIKNRLIKLHGLYELTGGNWQKWKRVFLTCPCHEIYRDEAVGLKSCKNTWKITIFVKMWNLGQYRENLIFCQ